MELTNAINAAVAEFIDTKQSLRLQVAGELVDIITKHVRPIVDEAAQFRTGHLPTCGGLDEAAGRCACGYLQGEAYRELIAEREEATALGEKLGDLLKRTAHALKGEPAPNVMHDWSDLPAVAKDTVRKLNVALERYAELANVIRQEHERATCEVDPSPAVDVARHLGEFARDWMVLAKKAESQAVEMAGQRDEAIRWKNLAIQEEQRARDERDKLRAIINTPEIANFLIGASNEAAHQRLRWPAEQDAGKTDADWFWLIGYLAGKALHNLAAGNTDKGLHHIITTAAACANWHRQRTAGNDMRPGIADQTQPAPVPVTVSDADVERAAELLHRIEQSEEAGGHGWAWPYFGLSAERTKRAADFVRKKARAVLDAYESARGTVAAAPDPEPRHILVVPSPAVADRLISQLEVIARAVECKGPVMIDVAICGGTVAGKVTP